MILLYRSSLVDRALHSVPTRRSSDLRSVIEATDTDGWMLLHNGTVLTEEYFGAMTPSTEHLLMSVSKSLVSTVPLRSEEHTSELQSRFDIVCRLLLETKKRGNSRDLD